MEKLPTGEDAQNWIIGVTFASGIQFKGTREEASSHADEYVEHLQGIFKEHGLAFMKREQLIVRRPAEGIDGRAA